MKNIDLRMLEVIRELHRTRSVSHAAQNLGLSQSAVSMSLARLRTHFTDPLFVRTSQGMEPTPYAADLIVDLQRAADILESAMERRAHFDAQTSDRMFHLISTDIAQFTVLPLLVKKLAVLAPAVRIDLNLLTDRSPRQLESGEADVAIGLISQLGAGFCQQKLFSGEFLCAVRHGHPRIKIGLTLKQFEEESHLSVTTIGTGYEALEKAIETQHIRRRIGMRVPSFLGVTAIIAVTDYVVIVPGSYGQILAESGGLRLFPVPFPFPGYNVSQNWHERYTHDPAQQWFRNLILRMFRERTAEAAIPIERRSRLR